jgi:branched-subunit amino acid transport protein
MSTAWTVVVVTGIVTLALKAAGPVLLGGRPLPDPVARFVALLGPALLAALVATTTLASGTRLVLDARAVGLAAAALAVWRRAPVLLAVGIAAAVTALARVV